MVKTKYFKLPFSFDINRLNDDLNEILDDEWISHFNRRAYEKKWSCVPLRSVDGRIDHIV